MPLPQKQEYTIEDIYALPDDVRAELIDGKIYYMAPPSSRHQALLSELHYFIKDYIKSTAGDCKIFPSPFAVFLNEDDTKYIEPDISVICDRSKIDDKGCHGAPDWIIEIVSPGSKQMDYYVKLFKYRTAGVREYWIVDPIKSGIMTYCFESEDIADYTFADKVKVNIYDDFFIDFAQIEVL